MKTGDTVLVWSLQSFSHGGFLDGEPAFLAQDEDSGGSLLLVVRRKINGKYQIDHSYEVYKEQTRAVEIVDWPATPELSRLRGEYLRQDWYYIHPSRAVLHKCSGKGLLRVINRQDVDGILGALSFAIALVSLIISAGVYFKC